MHCKGPRLISEIELLHEELSDGHGLLTADADEVGALGKSGEVDGELFVGIGGEDRAAVHVDNHNGGLVLNATDGDIAAGGVRGDTDGAAHGVVDAERVDGSLGAPVAVEITRADSADIHTVLGAWLEVSEFKGVGVSGDNGAGAGSMTGRAILNLPGGLTLGGSPSHGGAATGHVAYGDVGHRVAGCRGEAKGDNIAFG